MAYKIGIDVTISEISLEPDGSISPCCKAKFICSECATELHPYEDICHGCGVTFGECCKDGG